MWPYAGTYTGCASALTQCDPNIPCRWEFATEDKAFSSAVKVIYFDEDQNAWVGDEAGKVKVVRLSIVTSIGQGSAPNSCDGHIDHEHGGKDHKHGGSRAKLEVLATLQQSLLSRMAEGARTFMPSMFAKLGAKCEEREREREREKGHVKHNEGPIRCADGGLLGHVMRSLARVHCLCTCEHTRTRCV